MKQTKIGLLATAAAFVLSSTSAFATVNTTNEQGEYMNPGDTTDAVAEIVYNNPTPAITTTFIQNNKFGNTNEKQNAGSIKVSGLRPGVAYVLGNATINGDDSAGYSSAAGAGFGWTASLETNNTDATNLVATTDTAESTAYVKINHSAATPVPGKTTITIPIHTYSK